MSIEALEREMPWGLHDARLLGVDIDWVRRMAVFRVRAMYGEHQDASRRAELTVSGLEFCKIEGPPRDCDDEHDPMCEEGLWIDSHDITQDVPARAKLPKLPTGCFLHSFYVHDWNGFIHVCGRTASIEWLDLAPVPFDNPSPALFPGDEIPSPDED